MKRFLFLAACLLVVFASLYVLAERLGYADGAFLVARFEALQASPGGRVWVAVAIAGLLAVDLVLPVPSSVLMTFSGAVLGVGLGTAVSLAGAMLSAALGFGACRWGGQRAFRGLMGAQDLTRVNVWFQAYGVYAIVLSRPVPMLTEILSCLAGLTDLPGRTFFLAVVLGTLPVCLVYAYAGSISSPANPWPAVLIALLVPAAGWVAVRRIKGRA